MCGIAEAQLVLGVVTTVASYRNQKDTYERNMAADEKTMLQTEPEGRNTMMTCSYMHNRKSSFVYLEYFPKYVKPSNTFALIKLLSSSSDF